MIHVAGHNFGILMRRLISVGILKEATAHGRVLLLVAHSMEISAVCLFAVHDADDPA
ncbi:MAG: hypothetical protein HWD60_17085 [Defluviicoccus sp.]|nr:MAG: hypothetical protein HWD60_17085 [Defluviicoccus sp.]